MKDIFLFYISRHVHTILYLILIIYSINILVFYILYIFKRKLYFSSTLRIILFIYNLLHKYIKLFNLMEKNGHIFCNEHMNRSTLLLVSFSTSFLIVRQVRWPCDSHRVLFFSSPKRQHQLTPIN